MHECGTCKRTFRSPEDAEKCCTCECGTSIPMNERGAAMWQPSKCETCVNREQIRYAQERVRKLRSELAETERHLAKLVEKREVRKKAVRS